jgi:hypothetical protein
VKDHALWDGDVCNVQVIETTPTSIQVRLLISARDSGAAWDLRCHLREKIIEWLAAHHPRALPHTRLYLDPEQRLPAAASRER